MSDIVLRNQEMAESYQHKLDRVRRPRVQITYDVETNGAMVKKELPFVVGVMADLSAQRKDPLPALRDRKFVPIVRDNINDVMAEAAPALGMRVNNSLAGDGSQIAVNLKFSNLEDFEPARVAEQVAPLKELLDMRRRIEEVLAKMESNMKLEGLLQEVLSNQEKVQELAKQMGIDTSAPAPDSEEK
jgi:type VI secretion system protein ImpB